MLNKLSFSSKVLLALLFGIITGIVFGESVAWLNIVGTAFIKLLQIPVIPYIFLSLVVGLGSLSVNQAKEIAKKFGLMLVIFWTLGLLVVFALSLSFPEWQSSQFFNATQITLPAEINYFDLYIPSNPFKSFSEGTIPAVVIFSGFLGLALINIENKEYFLAPAKTLIDALSKITKTTITLLPLGIFTLSAAAAGTLYPDDFEKLQIYFLLFIVAALILSLWVMPLFVSAITPFKYRDIVQDCRDILVTAFATGNLFILLPTIIETCNDIFIKYQLQSEETNNYNEIIIPVAYNFPHLGNILSLSFILFSAWFNEADLDYTQNIALAFNGIFSLFASTHISIPFLLNTLHMPADMYQLYLAGDVITRRFSSLTAAVFFLSITLTTTALLVNVTRFNLRRILRFLGLTIGMIASFILIDHSIFTKMLPSQQDLSTSLRQMQVDWDSPSQIQYTLPKTDHLGEHPATPEQIIKRGYLRIGFNPDRVPFSYYNVNHKLVGFDVEMMNHLATALGVKLELIPFDNQSNLYAALDNLQIDIVISGVQINERYISKVLYTQPTMTLTTALIVKDYRQKEFLDFSTFQDKSLKLATLEHYPRMSFVQRNFPDIKISKITSIKEFFDADETEFDGLISSVEEGMTLTMLYPEYAVSFDKNRIHRFPVSYAVHNQNLLLHATLNSWLDIQRTTGRSEQLYQYWIEGQGAVNKAPRRSIIDYFSHQSSTTSPKQQ
ncbi:hypothetical protein A1359_08985 [Methylomonas lenta]|uniref:Solute-binding protein family 3/N-terminal domain-containing protein n=1 Tax=Methylomonas lenta TaxID=980561 RepID=A0A177NG28_9GAMM|nr:cation:dicarboxylase symporter family transporter [Methylomonas lenta]OAI16139.1 hypothetical protein A1359_08985 [Methylomonas lenta]